MWTKHFTADGLVYFYNASLNQSVWHPPENGIVHIAPFLEYQSQSELHYVYNTELEPAVRHVSDPTSSNNDSVAGSAGGINALANDGSTSSHAVDNSTVRAKGNTAKRFKSNHTNEEDSTQNTSESSYLRQKAELEAMMGCKKDDSSKWLVR